VRAGRSRNGDNRGCRTAPRDRARPCGVSPSAHGPLGPRPRTVECVSASDVGFTVNGSGSGGTTARAQLAAWQSARGTAEAPRPTAPRPGAERQDVRRPRRLPEHGPRVTFKPHDVNGNGAGDVGQYLGDVSLSLPSKSMVVSRRAGSNGVCGTNRVADREQDQSICRDDR
jgi:hypothetical protein